MLSPFYRHLRLHEAVQCVRTDIPPVESNASKAPIWLRSAYALGLAVKPSEAPVRDARRSLEDEQRNGQVYIQCEISDNSRNQKGECSNCYEIESAMEQEESREQDESEGSTGRAFLPSSFDAKRLCHVSIDRYYWKRD